MRKSFSLIPVILSLCLMSSLATPSFAATRQATTSRTTQANATKTQPVQHRPGGSPGSGYQKTNQDIDATVIDSQNRSYQGQDVGNTGNREYNSGYNEDMSKNNGNQILNKNTTKHSINTQHFRVFLDDSVNVDYSGYNVANSGNGGYNTGFNRDSSNNLANQTINN